MPKSKKSWGKLIAYKPSGVGVDVLLVIVFTFWKSAKQSSVTVV